MFYEPMRSDRDFDRDQLWNAAQGARQQGQGLVPSYGSNGGQTFEATRQGDPDSMQRYQDLMRQLAGLR